MKCDVVVSKVEARTQTLEPFTTPSIPRVCAIRRDTSGYGRGRAYHLRRSGTKRFHYDGLESSLA
jgi:hypothetical protein